MALKTGKELNEQMKALLVSIQEAISTETGSSKSILLRELYKIEDDSYYSLLVEISKKAKVQSTQRVDKLRYLLEKEFELIN
jgi:hypothetical protein